MQDIFWQQKKDNGQLFLKQDRLILSSTICMNLMQVTAPIGQTSKDHYQQRVVYGHIEHLVGDDKNQCICAVRILQMPWLH